MVANCGRDGQPEQRGAEPHQRTAADHDQQGGAAGGQPARHSSMTRGEITAAERDGRPAGRARTWPRTSPSATPAPFAPPTSRSSAVGVDPAGEAELDARRRARRSPLMAARSGLGRRRATLRGLVRARRRLVPPSARAPATATAAPAPIQQAGPRSPVQASERFTRSGQVSAPSANMKWSALIIGPTPDPRLHTSNVLPPTSTADAASPSRKNRRSSTGSELATEMASIDGRHRHQRAGHQPVPEPGVEAPPTEDGAEQVAGGLGAEQRADRAGADPGLVAQGRQRWADERQRRAEHQEAAEVGPSGIAPGVGGRAGAYGGQAMYGATALRACRNPAFTFSSVPSKARSSCSTTTAWS